MQYEAEGTLYKSFDAEQITARFRKRAFVVELGSGSRYPQLVQFELTGDRCELLDAYDVGTVLRVTFRLRGREWQSREGDARYFNSLDVLEIAGPEVEGPPDLDGPPPAFDGPPPSDDDIPF